MHIAFRGWSGGLEAINVSVLYLAIGETGHVYEIWSSGTGQTFVAAGVRSVEHLGSQIPDTDANGHASPASLQQKTVVFEVDPGVSLWSAHRIKFKIQSVNGSQDLYNWEGRIPMNSSAYGGFKVDGTARRARAASYPSYERNLYRSLMWYSNDESQSEESLLFRGHP